MVAKVKPVKTMQENGDGHNKPVDNTFGFLLWWTLHQGVYELTGLQAKAEQLENFPASIRDMLVGAEPKSAWLKATNLGLKGHKGMSYDPSTSVAYYSRDVGDGVRAIIREMIDKTGKMVSTEQVALLVLDESDNTIAAQIMNTLDPLVQRETVSILEKMQEDLENRIGKIDDTKLRTNLLAWLTHKHRVCVRGTGGVYYLPTSHEHFADLRNELLDVRTFVKECHLGTLSVVKMTNDGATSIEDVRDSAVAEIMAELDQVSTVLDRYESKKDSDFSYVYSDMPLERLAQAQKKIMALEEALGDILVEVQIEYDLAMDRAKNLKQEVQAVRSINGRNQKGKKAGTVKERSRKSAI